MNFRRKTSGRCPEPYLGNFLERSNASLLTVALQLSFLRTFKNFPQGRDSLRNPALGGKFLRIFKGLFLKSLKWGLGQRPEVIHPICGGKHRLSPAHLGYRRAVLRQRQPAEQGLPRLPLHPRPPIYRPRQNFDRAYELKRDDQSVREVARRMGFENDIYFFSFFRKNTGMTPLQ